MRRRAPHAGATLPAARWLGPLLTAAVLLAAAPDPASAQSYSGSPKLYRSSLNGATITLTGIYFGDGVAGQVSQYGILDWPGSGSGSLSIQSVSTNQGAGTVTLTLAYTGTFVTDQSIRITLNELVTSAGDHLTLGSIPVFVSDPGLAVGAVARPVAEYGTTATFTVKLQTQPSAAVTVAVTSQDTSEGRVSPASLLFSTSTWNTARTVTVTGVDDTLTDNDQTWNVRLDPSSSDTAYNGLSNVDVAVTTLDDEGAPVVNSVTITSTPATRGTYVLGETIAVRVGFDRSVTVTGTPQLALTVGTATRQAAYAAGSGSAMLTFRYPVQAGDADGNGIAIGAAALTLNGGQIRRTGGTVSARLGLGASALTDAAGHEVDAVHGPPGVRGVAISSPVGGTVFERGETIAVTVTFNKPVAVTGTPQLALTIGTATRQAAYAAGASTATALTFRYTVVQADADADGLSIGAGALTLNGGTIRQAGSPTVNAELGLGFRAIANSAAHRVTGGTVTTPAVTAIRVTSTPVFFSSRVTIDGPAYRRGEVIEITVTFSRPVTVTGTPIVPIDLPSTDNYASFRYVSGTGTRRLVFHYTVPAGHVETVALRLQGDDLLLNGGTINDARDSTTAATLTVPSVQQRLLEQQRHEVDADLLPTGIRLSQSTLAVTEGSTGAYTVRLNSAPTSAVVVTATRSSTLLGLQRPLDATWAAAATLTFTGTTWNTGQTVRVRGEADADAASGRATITHAVVDAQSADAFDPAPDQVLAVTVTDDEQAAILVSPSRLEVREAAEAAYTVRLSHVPTGNVRVLLISSDKAHARVSTTAGGPYAGDWSVQFTPTTWNTQQTVYVEGREDANRVTESETIRHTVYAQGSADEYDAVTAALPVTIRDNDGGLTVDPQAVTVTEGDTTTGVPYTVALSTTPGGPVTVTVNVPSGNLVTAVPGALTYSPTNWNTAQTVTVTAAAGADDGDANDETATLTHTAAAGSGNTFTFAARTADNVTVTIADDETPAIVLSESSLTVTEGTSPTATYTVALGAQPTGGVEVLVSRGDAGYLLNKVGGTQAASQTLTFTTSTWNTGQAITVIALDDANTAGGTSNITHTTVDANTADEYDAVSENLQVTLIDDEATIAVSRGTGALALTEGGNATYSVALAGQPTGAVVVDVSSNDAGAAAVAPAALTYSATTWNTGQAVTVSAVSDADSDDETVTVTHAVNDANSADEFDPAPDVTFTVNVTDNTPYRGEFDSGHGGSTISIAPAELFAVVGPQLLTISSTQATFFNPYTVHLCPFTSVPRSTGASVSGCTTIANRAATNRIDWNVSVTQAMVTNGGFVVMVKQAIGTFSNLVIYANWVPLVTPRTPTLVLAPTSITENGGVSTVTATLSSAPTAAVTLTVGAAAVSPAVAGDFTLSAGATLTFATGATASTGVVTLTAADNAVDAADKRVTVTGSVASPDRRVIAPAAATLTITDDDTAGVAVDTDPSTPAVVDATALAVTEDGTTTTATYTVVLGTEPTGPVTITVTSGDAAVAIDTDATPQTRTLTFSPTSWATAQTVTVVGQDDVDGDSEAVSLAHVATSGDAGYAGFTIAAVTVNVADDDAPGFLVSPTGLALTEGASGSYTLRLNSQPSGPVTVAVGAPTNTDVTGAPSSLTYSATTWNTAQTVTVSVASDADGLNETATVTHTATSSDSNYTIATARPAEHVTVTVTDANPPGLAVTPTTLALTEEDATAGSGTYTVRLNALPGGLVTVSVTSGDAAVTVAPGALTYSATTWNTAQAVTATAVADANPTGETVVVTHAVSGTADTTSYPTTLALTAADVTVTVTDDDVPGLVVSATALTTNGVNEGSTATYTVRLNTQPAGTGPQTVTVTVSSNNADVPADVDGDAGNGAQTTLTYTTASWATAQAVTVRAGEDADAADDAVTWTHATSGADYGTVAAAELAFTVNDDETAGIEVDTAPGTMGVQTGDLVVTEEDATLGRAAYTVVLTAQPVGGAVTVGVASGDASEVTVAPTALVFSATNWNTARTVTATAVADADQGDRETVTVTHTVSGTADATSYPTTLAAVTVTVQVRDDDRRVWKSTAFEFDVSTTVLFSTATAQSVVTQVPSDHPVQSWSTRRILACAWTAVRPVPVGGGLPAECTVINDRPNVTGTLSSPITPTQAMRDNGGVVIGMTVTSSEYVHVFFYTEWVPLVTPRTPTLVLAPATVPEAGGVATVTARLSSAPTAAVTLTVAASAVSPAVAGDFTLSAGPTLTFATGATTSTGTVTLTAVDNAVDAADKQVTVTGTVASTDDRVVAPAAVTLTLTDDDTAGVAVDTDVGTVGVQTGALALLETGPGSGTYTVVLGTEPTTPVTVTIASDDAGAVSRAPAALTFGTTSWATAQTVVATAVADADAVDERVALTHTLTGAAEYVGSAGPPVVAGVTVADVVVTVEDAEEQGLTLTPPAVTVAEDGAMANTEATYTVVLDSQPTAPVVVRIGSDNTDVHAMPGLLQYAASNWNTAQTVTVRADADADARADMATLTHTAAGGDYTGQAVETLAVTVTDNDAGVEVSRRALTVVDGQTARYTVALAAAPAGPVTVTATSSDTNVAIVGPTQNPASRAVVFTAGNWQTAQAVPVTGIGAGTATLSHVVSGYGSVVSAASVAVGVVGTGTGFLRIVPQALTVLEGASGTYTVGLGTEPTGPVTVTVGAPSNTNSAITRAPGALTFDATSWGTAQAVTVTAGTDAGTTEGSATIAHTVTGYGSVTSGPSVTVTEDEDETPTLGAVAAQTYRAGQAVSVRLPGATVGSGNPPLRYALTGPLPATDLTLPAGLAFAAATRRLQGTPGAAAAAATYRLTVTDVNGSTATQDFALTVADNPLPGFAAAVPFMRHPLNQAAEQTLPAPTNMDNRDLTFVVTPALPTGLRYVPPTKVGGAYITGGQIVGTPTAATPQRQYRLTVVDAQGNEAAVTFALATGAAPAAPGPADRQPRFGNATVEPQRYTVGTAVTLTLPAATNGDGRLTYTLEPAELPAGLTYTPPAAGAATGGTLAGTPTAVHPATTYTLTATDADGDPAELTFTVEVGAAGAIRPQDGTRTYTVNGQQVTVTQAPGTLAGIALTVTQPARLDGAVTITLAPPGADVPVVRGGYGFGPAGARAVVALTVAPVPAGGLDVCLPVPAEVRTAAGTRAVVLVRYTGQQWEPVAGAEDDAAAGQVCAAGMTAFGPLGVGYANRVPTFEDRTVGALALQLQVNEAHAVPLPAATGGDGAVRYTLTPPDLPAGLTYTPPAAGAATGGVIAGTPAAETAARAYTLTATDVDGDTAELPFTLEVVRTPVRVTVTDATAVEGRPVEFAVSLSRAAGGPLTLGWTAGRPGSATPGEDYEAVAAGQLTVAAGATAGTLVVRTLDDRRVEPVETFTVTVTLPAETSIELAQGTAAGRIEDDDTERARQRSLGMVLAGVGRTLATDAVDVIGDRFARPPTAAQATVGGQAVDLDRGPQRGRWRHAAGVAYGVARALGVEVGSPLEGGDGQFGQVRGAAWSTLTRHLRDPHAPPPPLSAWDAPGAFAGAPAGPGWGGPSAGWGTAGLAGGSPTIPPPSGRGLELAPDSIRGDGFSVGQSPASGLPFGHAALPGLAGYSNGLGQLGFDRAHAAAPQAVQVGAFQAPVQFRRVSGAEVLSQSEFELPLSGPASPADPPPAASVAEADPAATDPLMEPAAQAAAATWTLWGRGTASGFNGKPKDDFSMDGNVFTGYLGVDYRLQPNVLLGLAVAHSQGDVDYETTDVTKGDVDVTLTSVLPYAHWSPRPGLGVWGLFGAGWGDLKLRDEAGKVKTDLEMLLGAVGARQEVLTWRRIDVALKADAFLTELEAGSDDRLPETAGDAQRVRLMVEGRTAWALSEDSHLTPVFEVGGRWDGGKAETGVGAEMGGGFEYAHTQLGLGVEARGRYLLAHQKSAFDEWGASLTLRLDPGADKRGLWLALAPVWGAEASQVEQMWGSADVLRANGEADTQPDFSPAQVEFDVGYGMVTHEGAGLLTTYGGLSMLGPHSHGVRLGGRLALGEWIDLSVEGERTTQGGGAEHQVALYGHLGW